MTGYKQQAWKKGNWKLSLKNIGIEEEKPSNKARMQKRTLGLKLYRKQEIEGRYYRGVGWRIQSEGIPCLTYLQNRKF